MLSVNISDFLERFGPTVLKKIILNPQPSLRCWFEKGASVDTIALLAVGSRSLRIRGAAGDEPFTDRFRRDAFRFLNALIGIRPEFFESYCLPLAAGLGRKSSENRHVSIVEKVRIVVVRVVNWVGFGMNGMWGRFPGAALGRIRPT